MEERKIETGISKELAEKRLAMKKRIQLIVRVRPFLDSETKRECLQVLEDNEVRLFREY